MFASSQIVSIAIHNITEEL